MDKVPFLNELHLERLNERTRPAVASDELKGTCNDVDMQAFRQRKDLFLGEGSRALGAQLFHLDVGVLEERLFGRVHNGTPLVLVGLMVGN